MLVYLLSFVIYVWAFFSGFGEKGVKSKILTVSAMIVASYNIYAIFTKSISNNLFVNILLCIIPLAVFLIGLLFIDDKDDSKEKNHSYKSSKKTAQYESVNKTNIVDNELTNKQQSSKQETDFSEDSDDNNITHTPLNEDEKINYKDSRIDGYGSCDVEETDEYIKITMKADGKEYDFYVENGNIVAYRTNNSGKVESY